MTDPKEPSEEQREFVYSLIDAYYRADMSERRVAPLIAARDAAQFRRGVEAAIAVVERDLTKGDYSAWKALDDVLTELRNLRGDDDG